MTETTKTGSNILPRYSNKTVVGNDGTTTTTAWYEDIDWSGGLNSLTNLFSSIWGKSSIYTANMYKNMYDEQRRTTVILWCVIALIAILGVFVFIKKTK